MQAVAVAISPTGIDYLMQTLLGAQIAKTMEAGVGKLPDLPLNVPSFYDGWGTKFFDIDINLSDGQIRSFTPVFTSCKQTGDSFAIEMTAQAVETVYTWTESYTSQEGAGKYRPPPQNHGPNTYSFTINLATLIITATFTLAVTGGAYKLTYVSSSADPGGQTPDIPSQSVINKQTSWACPFKTQISNATSTQLESIKYGSLVATALSPIFASIADSGKLGPVEFDFLVPSPAGVTYPGGGGIQIGVTGEVTVGGAPYPEPAPAGVALPPVPTGNPAPHVLYYVQDYEVDALFWGFFAAGTLQTVLSAKDISDGSALETVTYKGTSFDILFKTYPACPMTAALSALTSPTVTFAIMYQFTAATLAQVQQALPADLWSADGDEIEQLTTFVAQTDLEQTLQQIDPDLMPYAAKIEQLTEVPGIVLQHDVRCVLNVIHRNDTIPVITFDVANRFVMQNLELGLSSPVATQSVLFNFVQPYDVTPQATFVSSTLPGVNQSEFLETIWTALEASWMGVLTAVGQAGVPLPRIPGFEFLFDQASVVVVPATGSTDGYLAVTANVEYDPGARLGATASGQGA